ncbi:hypothetical protein KY289_001456 [Solanum tuberosum]|nr:hypothetical protein KY289_001456 [Solanum tuberosum]
MEALAYFVPYEYVPFAAPDGKSSGDTTIVSNRSQFVDFTLPYTESGVTMMVPIKDDNRDSAWALSFVYSNIE